MHCYLKGIVEISLDAANEDFLEDTEQMNTYVQNWNLLPEAVEEILQSTLPECFSTRLHVAEIKNT